MSTKYILAGGYMHKAADGGKAFVEELVRGFEGPVKILECAFARERSEWQAAYEKDIALFTRNAPVREFAFQLADETTLLEQIRWADVVYLRGGSHEDRLIAVLTATPGWTEALEGKTLVGASAGADVMAVSSYNLDELALHDGLGVVPVKCIPHFGSDYNAPNIDWGAAVALLDAYGPPLPIAKVPEGGFQVFHSTGVRC